MRNWVDLTQDRDVACVNLDACTWRRADQMVTSGGSSDRLDLGFPQNCFPLGPTSAS